MSFRLSTTCVSHYGRKVFFSYGRTGDTWRNQISRICLNIPPAWRWSLHRCTRANYYRFRVTTSALTWSGNARSKCDMCFFATFISPGFRMRRFHHAPKFPLQRDSTGEQELLKEYVAWNSNISLLSRKKNSYERIKFATNSLSKIIFRYFYHYALKYYLKFIILRKTYN